MPLHDWTRVDRRDYASFSLGWLTGLVGELNRGGLPADYYATFEYSAPVFLEGVTIRELLDTAEPDRMIDPLAVRPGPPTDTAPVRPKGLVIRHQVGVRRAADRRVVALVELLLPAAKRRPAEWTDLVTKSALHVRNGIGLVVVDPFRPTRLAPDGFHPAFWTALTRRGAAAPPADKPLTVASYALDADGRCRAFVTPLAAGDPLPDPPLFLRPGLPVRLPLAAAYQAGLDGFPKSLRPA